MIGPDDLPRRVRGLDAATALSWVAAGWVRPARAGDPPAFDEVDLARFRLIVELREEMEVGDSAIPVVLGLLDQLHATRRHLRMVAEALERLRGG